MKHKEKWLPVTIMLLIMGLVMGSFMVIKSCNNDMIQQIGDVAGEATDPSVGRLIACVLFFVLSVAFMLLSDRIWKKNPERLQLPWSLSAVGGTLLWVSIGECLWHFGFDVVSDEGEMLFSNFPRIESIQGMPFLIPVALVVVMLLMQKNRPFPLLVHMMTFLANWYGHLCMIGAYPIALASGVEMELASFYRLSGLINFVIFLFAGIYLTYKKTGRETKYYAATFIYLALGTLIFGVILGET